MAGTIYAFNAVKAIAENTYEKITAPRAARPVGNITVGWEAFEQGFLATSMLLMAALTAFLICWLLYYVVSYVARLLRERRRNRLYLNIIQEEESQVPIKGTVLQYLVNAEGAKLLCAGDNGEVIEIILEDSLRSSVEGAMTQIPESDFGVSSNLVSGSHSILTAWTRGEKPVKHGQVQLVQLKGRKTTVTRYFVVAPAHYGTEFDIVVENYVGGHVSSTKRSDLEDLDWKAPQSIDVQIAALLEVPSAWTNIKIHELSPLRGVTLSELGATAKFTGVLNDKGYVESICTIKALGTQGPQKYMIQHNATTKPGSCGAVLASKKIKAMHISGPTKLGIRAGEWNLAVGFHFIYKLANALKYQMVESPWEEIIREQEEKFGDGDFVVYGKEDDDYWAVAEAEADHDEDWESYKFQVKNWADATEAAYDKFVGDHLDAGYTWRPGGHLKNQRREHQKPETSLIENVVYNDEDEREEKAEERVYVEPEKKEEMEPHRRRLAPVFDPSVAKRSYGAKSDLQELRRKPLRDIGDMKIPSNTENNVRTSLAVHYRLREQYHDGIEPEYAKKVYREADEVLRTLAESLHIVGKVEAHPKQFASCGALRRNILETIRNMKGSLGNPFLPGEQWRTIIESDDLTDMLRLVNEGAAMKGSTQLATAVLMIKEEPHSAEKIAQQRYRIIEAISGADTILDRQAFGPFLLELGQRASFTTYAMELELPDRNGDMGMYDVRLYFNGKTNHRGAVRYAMISDYFSRQAVSRGAIYVGGDDFLVIDPDGARHTGLDYSLNDWLYNEDLHQLLKNFYLRCSKDSLTREYVDNRMKVAARIRVQTPSSKTEDMECIFASGKYTTFVDNTLGTLAKTIGLWRVEGKFDPSGLTAAAAKIGYKLTTIVDASIFKWAPFMGMEIKLAKKTAALQFRPEHRNKHLAKLAAVKEEHIEETLRSYLLMYSEPLSGEFFHLYRKEAIARGFSVLGSPEQWFDGNGKLTIAQSGVPRRRVQGRKNIKTFGSDEQVIQSAESSPTRQRSGGAGYDACVQREEHPSRREEREKDFGGDQEDLQEARAELEGVSIDGQASLETSVRRRLLDGRSVQREVGERQDSLVSRRTTGEIDRRESVRSDRILRRGEYRDPDLLATQSGPVRDSGRGLRSAHLAGTDNRERHPRVSSILRSECRGVGSDVGAALWVHSSECEYQHQRAVRGSGRGLGHSDSLEHSQLLGRRDSQRARQLPVPTGGGRHEGVSDVEGSGSGRMDCIGASAGADQRRVRWNEQDVRKQHDSLHEGIQSSGSDLHEIELGRQLGVSYDDVSFSWKLSDWKEEHDDPCGAGCHHNGDVHAPDCRFLRDLWDSCEQSRNGIFPAARICCEDLDCDCLDNWHGSSDWLQEGDPGCSGTGQRKGKSASRRHGKRRANKTYTVLQNRGLRRIGGTGSSESCWDGSSVSIRERERIINRSSSKHWFKYSVRSSYEGEVNLYRMARHVVLERLFDACNVYEALRSGKEICLDAANHEFVWKSKLRVSEINWHAGETLYLVEFITVLTDPCEVSTTTRGVLMARVTSNNYEKLVAMYKAGAEEFGHQLCAELPSTYGDGVLEAVGYEMSFFME